MRKPDDSSDSDEDPRMAHKKVQKKAPPQQNFQMEIASKTMTKNMFQQRGLEFNDDDLKKMGLNSAANSASTKKGGGFIAGGSEATLEELKKELVASQKKGDSKTSSLVIKYILEKDLPSDIKKSYVLQRCMLLIDIRAYTDCVLETEKWISSSQDQKDIESQKFCVNLRLFLAKAKSHLGEIWSGYLELLRAKGYCQGLILAKKEEAQGNGKNKDKKFQSQQDYNWRETESDLLLKELEDTDLHFKVKLNQERKIASFLYSSGFSNTGCLGLESIESSKAQILPPMRNRQVLSIACGDHHTVALIKAFPASLLFNPNYGQISQSFDHCFEVFSWGENTCGQVTGDSSVVKIIDHPLLISNFSGKFINVVGAYKASSMAVDLNGKVFEWGACKFKNIDTSAIDQTFSLPVTLINDSHKFINAIQQKEIVQIVRGQGLYAALDNKQQCYWWGTLKEGVVKQQFQTSKVSKVVGISAGNSHIVITNEDGKVFGLGDNSKKQLALGDKKFADEFEQIQQLQNTQIIQSKAFQDATLFVTAEGDLLYSGQISQTKRSDYAKEAEFPEQVIVTSCSGYDGELFAVSSSGVSYIWEADSSIKFKLHKSIAPNTFREILTGSGFQMLLKTLPVAQLSRISLETDTELETYESIDIQIQLRDQQGTWGIKPFYPMRYQLLISEDPKLKKEEIEQLARNFCNITKSKYTEEKVYIDEIGGSKLFTYSIEVNQARPHIHEIKLSLEQSGVFYLYGLLNEEQIGTFPIELDIHISSHEEQRREEQLLKEQKALEDARLRILKEEEKKRKAEELLEQQRREEELAQQKKKETDERAKEAYSKHLKDQSEKKFKDEEERKRKAELQTGGGFDLNKANLLNSQKSIPSKINRQESLLNSQNLTKPSSILEKTQSNMKTSNSLRPSLSSIQTQDSTNLTKKKETSITIQKQTTLTPIVRQPVQSQKNILGRPVLKKK